MVASRCGRLADIQDSHHINNYAIYIHMYSSNYHTYVHTYIHTLYMYVCTYICTVHTVWYCTDTYFTFTVHLPIL